MKRLKGAALVLKLAGVLTPLTILLSVGAWLMSGTIAVGAFIIGPAAPVMGALGITCVALALASAISALHDCVTAPRRRQAMSAEAIDFAIAMVMMQSLASTADTDRTVDGEGTLFTHHAEGQCFGQPCPIHAPSTHHMNGWPIIFERDKKPLISRRCPHRFNHPDPDSVAFIVSNIEGASEPFTDDQRDGVRSHWERHHCDGCCVAFKAPTSELPRLTEEASEPAPGNDELVALRNATAEAHAVFSDETLRGVRPPPFISSDERPYPDNDTEGSAR